VPSPAPRAARSPPPRCPDEAVLREIGVTVEQPAALRERGIV
jgi:hypothetical protein